MLDSMHHFTEHNELRQPADATSIYKHDIEVFSIIAKARSYHINTDQEQVSATHVHSEFQHRSSL